MKEEPLSEKDSLKLITEMIQKAKQSQFHNSGSSAILWGSVIGFAGIMSFLDRFFEWGTGFDWWLLVLVALVPQLIITARASRPKMVRSYDDIAVDTVWMVYGISIFALVIYFQVVPGQSDRLMLTDNLELFTRNTVTQVVKPQRVFIPSSVSLLMIIYAFPTLVTGIVKRTTPMLVGAVVCYMFFLASLFTPGVYDLLFSGLAGIGNWLIPGLLLRRKYRLSKANV